MGFVETPEIWVKPGERTTTDAKEADKRGDKSNRHDNGYQEPEPHKHQATSLTCIGNNGTNSFLSEY